MNRVRTLVQEIRGHLDTGNTEEAVEKLDKLESWVGTEKASAVSECDNCGSERLDFRPPEYVDDVTQTQRIPCRECGHVQIETWALKSVEEGEA